MENILQKYPRELNNYSEYMTVDYKEANKIHYRVKGHLIPEEWSDSDIVKMYDSYFARCWGNNEGGHLDEAFEAAWHEREETEIDKFCIRGYD